MLTSTQLSALVDFLQRESVLSVYVDGTATDPAEQRAWRTRLDQSLKDLRAWLADSPYEERDRFERCVAMLQEQLASFARGVGTPGWVTFLTPHGVRHAEHLPVPVPTMAVWSTGICAAPYVRALKELRPVVIVVADARKATVYHYGEGTLDKRETIRAHATTEPPLHMGDAPRSGFHPGVRGATGRDEAQRARLEGTAHMLAEVVEHVTRLAAPDAWILTGGIPEVSAHLARLLSRSAPNRVRALESLDIHASEADVAAAARQGASALRDAADLRHIAEIMERADGDGLATLGPATTRLALQQSQVRELYFTHRYLEDHAADAEDAVRAALMQRAQVEEVSRDAARELDQHGGVAARLRYRLASVGAE